MKTNLILHPNPVKIKETLYIEADFIVSEQQGLLVEVFNSVGQKVLSTMPKQYPIQLKGLDERGVYIIRIQTVDGNVYQGKVIVK